MIRGEFHLGNGSVIPNNITEFGAALILSMALKDTAADFWVGLVDGVPDPALQAEDLIEPTFGTGGYARIQITRNPVGWPVAGTLNGEQFLESDWLVWEAVGANFDQATSRMAIFPTQTGRTGNVFALSAAQPGAVAIFPGMVLGDRRFKYRVYLR